MATNKSSKKKLEVDGEAAESSKRSGAPEKKKKFSLTQPTRKLWGAFQRETEKRLSTEDAGPSLRGSALGGAAGVADSGHLIGTRRDKLGLFEDDDFDVEIFTDECMAHLTEKGLDTLREDLTTLQETCEEEVQRVIHGQYPAFVKACEGVGELEVQFQQLRTLIAGSVSLVNDLKRASQPGAHKLDVHDDTLVPPVVASTKQGGRALESVLEELDVAVAERDFHVVKKLLRAGEEALTEAAPDAMSGLEYMIETRREKIVNLLESQLHDPTLGTHDQHHLFRVLVGVAGDVHTLKLLLNIHSQQLRQVEQHLLKPHRAGGSDPNGTDYVGSLSQCLFHTISHAIEDFQAIFTSPMPGLRSNLVVWARAETRHCCNLMKQHALSALAGPSGLASTVHCVSLALVYAMTLEEGQQLSLVNVVRTEVWGYVEGVLGQHFQSCADSLSTHVREELDNLVSSPIAWATASPRPSGRTGALHLACATRLLDEIDGVVDLLRPLGHPCLREPVLDGVDKLFHSFTGALIKCLADRVGDESMGVSLEGIMDTVAVMAERSIPKALSKLEGSTGRMGGAEMLQCHVDELARFLGMQEVD
ncbi:hypothetical protein BSKO_03924 [Bryopsis sp. KO-2023]|nr:hypothetical protein BSKO_03924 [Bryopsis sp. KO-2023]